MKKRKILYLFPLSALLLSGCSFQEVLATAKTFLSEKVVTPVSNLINGKKAEDKKEEEKKQDNTPGVAGDDVPEDVPETVVGSVEQPLSVSEFRAQLDELIDFSQVESGKSSSDTSHLFYVKAKVDGNATDMKDTGEIQYLNMSDPDNSDLKIVGHFAIIDDALKAEFGTTASIRGREVVVKGYGQLFNHASNGKQYQLAKKDNEHKPTVVKVFEEQGTEGINYGTLQAPLTVSEAKAVIDQESPTKVKMYVTGEVKTNEAWSTKYKNIMRITITDGTADLVIFKCGDFPADVEKENIAANSLKGKTVVANGIGELYESTTYELTGPQITSITGEGVQPVEIDNYGSLENPLSISEAKEVIDAEDPTKEPIYVTGLVKSNTAWTTGTTNSGAAYANMDIVLADGENEFTLYRAETLPAEFDENKPTENSLVGKIVVAHGTGTYYSPKYELKQGCVVDSVKDVEVTGVELSEQSLALEVGDQVALTASVLPAIASQEVTWTVESDPTTVEVAKYENGKVVAYAAGTAVVTATSVADPTKAASCTVTVTEAENPLLSIAFSGEVEKTAYNEEEAYSIEGLKVMAHYEKGDDVDVTENATISLSKEVAEVGDTSFKVTASFGTAEAIEQTIPVTVAEINQIAEAYAAAVALANKTESTEEYVIRGVVTAKRGSEYFIQSGDYGFDIYNPNNSEFAIGKMVRVKSTVKNYNRTYETGTISSATVTGDGTIPNPIVITSAADEEAARLNLLAEVEGVAKADVTVGTSDLSVVLLLGNDEITVYIKKNQLSAQGLSDLGNIKAGDTVTFTHLITGAYNANLQLLACDNSTLSVQAAPAKEIASITSVTGPTEVALNTTIQPSDVTVIVEYTDGSSGNATVTAVSCDTSAAGQVEADVTIEGWEATLHFTVTVVAPQAGEVTATFDADSMIADPSNYTGGSVKLTSEAIDSVLTVSIDATDGNSGKIYLDNNNGAQIRLYKSGTGKLVVTAKSGYEITKAVAISAPKGSNWWVAGSETNMTIASDKASCSIGGDADTVVYEVTITYVAK